MSELSNKEFKDHILNLARKYELYPEDAPPALVLLLIHELARRTLK